MNRREALTTLSRGAALGALAGTAVVAVSCQPIAAPAAEVDPLLALVNEYRAGMAVFKASPLTLTPEEDKALQAATWEPAYDRLCTDPPSATTLAGAIAGVRLVADEEENCGNQPDLTTKVLRAALAYFDGVA